MPLPVEFLEEAEAELDDGYAWYEHKAKLGLAFAGAVDDAIRRIEAHPEFHQRAVGQIRRAVVQRFPYCIYYLLESERIVVLAIFHARRDPTVLLDRS